MEPPVARSQSPPSRFPLQEAKLVPAPRKERERGKVRRSKGRENAPFSSLAGTDPRILARQRSAAGADLAPKAVRIRGGRSRSAAGSGEAAPEFETDRSDGTLSVKVQEEAVPTSLLMGHRRVIPRSQDDVRIIEVPHPSNATQPKTPPCRA